MTKEHVINVIRQNCIIKNFWHNKMESVEVAVLILYMIVFAIIVVLVYAY